MLVNQSFYVRHLLFNTTYGVFQTHTVLFIYTLSVFPASMGIRTLRSATLPHSDMPNVLAERCHQTNGVQDTRSLSVTHLQPLEVSLNPRSLSSSVDLNRYIVSWNPLRLPSPDQFNQCIQLIPHPPMKVVLPHTPIQNLRIPKHILNLFFL